ncbi:13E12 repeat family protein [Mycolicibacterium insubricum]|uniref:13E12 repeat family protein n=1 Tax=Mycolicibacterium insubricum TaxID=444597 RepID=UPI0021F2C81F|nr:13E12 repeat family protein [Mycolicibacterium insubricum]MCV7080736.1 DUF222 domain-containing protein [Mycolicibacterium insubricum]
MSRSAYADREAIFAALAAAEAAYEKLADCSLDVLTAEEVLDVLGRREELAWRQPAVDHRLLARLVADGNPGKLGAASLKVVLEERLRISRAAATRRLPSADLGPRNAMDGQPHPSVLVRKCGRAPRMTYPTSQGTEKHSPFRILTPVAR